MSEADTLFAALRQSTGDDIVALLERMVRDAPDHALNKINALDLAAKEGVGEDRVIAALLNAVGLGIVEMSWNVMCPSCAGVLSANKSLKTLDRAQYNCAFCAAGYETTLDNLGRCRDGDLCDARSRHCRRHPPARGDGRSRRPASAPEPAPEDGHP